MKRYDIINTLIDTFGLRSYLEVGVCNPRLCFDKINVEDKEGVDPAGKCKYQMTSDEFFKVCDRKYDLIFIDGLHEAEQVYRDIENALKVLNEGGFVVVHDCNPLVVGETIYNYSGTVYKGFIKARNNIGARKWGNGVNSFCVDADRGCGVITYRKLNKHFLPVDMDVDWSVFERYRRMLLDLVTIDEFKLLIKPDGVIINQNQE